MAGPPDFTEAANEVIRRHSAPSRPGSEETADDIINRYLSKMPDSGPEETADDVIGRYYKPPKAEPAPVDPPVEPRVEEAPSATTETQTRLPEQVEAEPLQSEPDISIPPLMSQEFEESVTGSKPPALEPQSDFWADAHEAARPKAAFESEKVYASPAEIRRMNQFGAARSGLSEALDNTMRMAEYFSQTEAARDPLAARKPGQPLTSAEPPSMEDEEESRKKIMRAEARGEKPLPISELYRQIGNLHKEWHSSPQTPEDFQRINKKKIALQGELLAANARQHAPDEVFKALSSGQLASLAPLVHAKQGGEFASTLRALGAFKQKYPRAIDPKYTEGVEPRVLPFGEASTIKEIDWEKSAWALDDDGENLKAVVEKARDYLREVNLHIVAKERGLDKGEWEAGPHGRMVVAPKGGDISWGAEGYNPLHSVAQEVMLQAAGIALSPATFVNAVIRDPNKIRGKAWLLDPDPKGTGYLGFVNAAAGATGTVAGMGARKAASVMAPGLGALGSTKNMPEVAARERDPSDRKFSEIFMENWRDEDKGFNWDQYLTNEWNAVAAIVGMPIHIVAGTRRAAYFWNSDRSEEEKVEAASNAVDMIVDEVARRYGRVLSLKADAMSESMLFYGYDAALLAMPFGAISKQISNRARAIAADKTGLVEVKMTKDPWDGLLFTSSRMRKDAKDAAVRGDTVTAANLALKANELELGASVIKKHLPALEAKMRNVESYKTTPIRGPVEGASPRGAKALVQVGRAAEGFSEAVRLLTVVTNKINPLFGPAFLLDVFGESLARGVSSLAKRDVLFTPSQAASFRLFLKSKDAQGVASDKAASMFRESKAYHTKKAYVLKDYLQSIPQEHWPMASEMARLVDDHVTSIFDRAINPATGKLEFTLKPNVSRRDGSASPVLDEPTNARLDKMTPHELDVEYRRVVENPRNLDHLPPDAAAEVQKAAILERVGPSGDIATSARLDKMTAYEVDVEYRNVVENPRNLDHLPPDVATEVQKAAIIDRSGSIGVYTSIPDKELLLRLHYANKFGSEVFPVIQSARDDLARMGVVANPKALDQFWIPDRYIRPDRTLRESIRQFFTSSGDDQERAVRLASAIDAVEGKLRVDNLRANIHNHAGPDGDISIPYYIRRQPHGGTYLDSEGMRLRHRGYNTVHGPTGKTYGELLEIAQARREGRIAIEGRTRFAALSPSHFDEIMGGIHDFIGEVEWMKAMDNIQNDPVLVHPSRKVEIEDPKLARAAILAPLKGVEKTLRTEGHVLYVPTDGAFIAKGPKGKHAISVKEYMESLFGRGVRKGGGPFGPQEWAVIGPPKGHKISQPGSVGSTWQLVAVENPKVHPNTLARVHGTLDGWVNPSIALEMSGTKRFVEASQSFGAKAIRIWKATKTILSAPAHVVNLTSNLLVNAPMAGISILNPQNWEHYAKVASQFVKGDGDIYRRWVAASGRGPESTLTRQESLRRAETGVGLYFSGMFAEPKRVYKDLAELSLMSSQGLWPKRMTTVSKGFARLLSSSPGTVYSVMDDLFRAVKFSVEAERAALRGLKPNDELYALMGRKAFADYENLSGAMRWVASSPFGQPFVAYDARRYGPFSTWADNNPFHAWLQQHVHDNMSRVNFRAAGVDYDDWEIVREGLPVYDRIKLHALQLSPELHNLLKDLGPEAKHALIDLVKMVPLGRSMGIPSERGLNRDISVGSFLGKDGVLVKPSLIKFGAANPLVSSLAAGFNYDMFRGQMITKDKDDPERPELTKQKLAAIWLPGWMPDVLQNALDSTAGVALAKMGDLLDMRIDASLRNYWNQRQYNAEHNIPDAWKPTVRSERAAYLGNAGFSISEYNNRGIYHTTENILKGFLGGEYGDKVKALDKRWAEGKIRRDSYETQREAALREMMKGAGFSQYLNRDRALWRLFKGMSDEGFMPPIGYTGKDSTPHGGWDFSELFTEKAPGVYSLKTLDPKTGSPKATKFLYELSLVDRASLQARVAELLGKTSDISSEEIMSINQDLLRTIASLRQSGQVPPLEPPASQMIIEGVGEALNPFEKAFKKVTSTPKERR